MDPSTGDSHGRLSPWRIDTTTTAGLMVVGAVLFLAFVWRGIGATASGSVRVGA